ncbi:phosphoribosylaminoimidazolesuccinocarboxamide synthase [Lactiplantibacillus fabifermentans]|uniref:Phosphoribosylaminoimidazole-succinocarboxamide synthase n=2 Tax=Lactiplantibacillus fabifermentans TaxID=483011 RepID=A0A0R2NS43_9LACO|nr:phosphoribosylaminoimidazolesuccinocarboxamide synthase [Lactiplantibacillus fabifermentans]ETY73526.1 phosphoribosylaminoimidazole-succinocarboxamide synthase [Lactiplantibacillus fabifermentans T30PCM01]KRO27248.1 phosphoribosylaminoimidazole-succinocarboxamide synthase [Lactiplantibacillus fabifermentans DSM 21115]
MTEIVKGDLLYTGKAKEMYATNDPDVLWVDYLDQATALNGKKKVAIDQKGLLNAHISSLIFTDLAQHGIKNHFIEQLSDRVQLVRRVKMIPLETVVRNAASGSFERKFAVDHLMKFDEPVLEFFYKSDALDDPFINDSQVAALKVASAETVAEMKRQALLVNDRLQAIFAEMGVQLVDFKIEFGLTDEGQVLLADEISPDSCRLVDEKTQKSLDKDVFRKDLGDLTTVYKEVLQRLATVEGSQQ